MIYLRVIDVKNFDDVINLKVTTEQKKFVASNMYSIAQAKVQPECIPLAIYDEETIVGFIMYCLDTEDKEYWIYRLMVDEKFQAKGYGKEAMKQVIEKIREDNTHHIIYISFEPENHVAKSLYESLGFVPDGRIIDDEIVYCLRCS